MEAPGALAQVIPQQGALFSGDRDEHRLAIRQAGARKCLDPRQVVTLIAVEECQVAHVVAAGRMLRHHRAARSLPSHHASATSLKLSGYAATCRGAG